MITYISDCLSAESIEEDCSLDGTYSQDDTNSQMSVESQSSEIGDNISDDDSFVKVTAGMLKLI